jgi:hypothetical protein
MVAEKTLSEKQELPTCYTEPVQRADMLFIGVQKRAFDAFGYK